MSRAQIVERTLRALAEATEHYDGRAEDFAELERRAVAADGSLQRYIAEQEGTRAMFADGEIRKRRAMRDRAERRADVARRLQRALEDATSETHDGVTDATGAAPRLRARHGRRARRRATTRRRSAVRSTAGPPEPPSLAPTSLGRLTSGRGTPRPAQADRGSWRRAPCVGGAS
jgi:hypothetical protein